MTLQSPPPRTKLSAHNPFLTGHADVVLISIGLYDAGRGRPVAIVSRVRLSPWRVAPIFGQKRSYRVLNIRYPTLRTPQTLPIQEVRAGLESLVQTLALALARARARVPALARAIQPTRTILIQVAQAAPVMRPTQGRALETVAPVGFH